MKSKLIILVALIVAAVAFAPQIHAQSPGTYWATSPVTFPANSLPAQAFTATAQTGATQIVNGSYATIELTGTITTVTWQLQGSNDAGTTWFPINTALITTPGTVATTQTSSTQQLYIANVAGLTAIRFVTSGTFTGTNVKIKATVTSNRGSL